MANPIDTSPLDLKKIHARLMQCLQKYGLYSILFLLGIGLSVISKNPFNNKDIGNIIVNKTYPMTACIIIGNTKQSIIWTQDVFQKLHYTIPLGNNSVPPIFFNRIPAHTSILNERERRIFLLQILLPPVIEASKNILDTKKEVKRLQIKINDHSLTREEEIWVRSIAKDYRVLIVGETFWDYKAIIDELEKRVDIIPFPITLAMILIAVDDGTNSDNIHSNQLFGNAKNLQKYPLATQRSFPSIIGAIQNMYGKVNTFRSYENLRARRMILGTEKKTDLSQWAMQMGNKAENSQAYANKIMATIHAYQLASYNTIISLDTEQQPTCVTI